MPDEVVDNVRSMRKIGEEKFKKLLDLRVNSQVEAFTDTISNNNLVLFKKALEIKKPSARLGRWSQNENNNRLVLLT